MRHETDQSETEEDPWPDGTEHFLVIGREFRVIGAVEPDPNDDKDTGTVIYEAGDEFPEEHMEASTWRAFGGDVFAALDENGERLDETEDDDDEIDASAVLNNWRRSQGGDDQVHPCPECGKEFATADGLNGHQSAHRND